MSKIPLLFAPITVTRQSFVEALLRYEGIRYEIAQTSVWQDSTGKMCGYANCYGVLILALVDLGLLPAGFDANIDPTAFGQPRAKTLVELIRTNADELPSKNLVRPGDVMLLRYKDRDKALNDPHHVAACIGLEPLELLHAEITSANGTGKVQRYLCGPQNDPNMWSRVHEVWSMRNFSDE